MTDATDNLVLEHLRALRADVSDVKNDMRDVKARLGSIESYIATLHADQARTGTKLDDIVHRVERLEKRTGLIDAE
jgi:phage shock protein A